MSNNRRFALDEKRHVIDAVNPANSGKGYCHEGDPEDDRHLRERVLMVPLGKMLDKLIINLRPTKKCPSGEEYQPFNEERHAMWVAMLAMIRASHLGAFGPKLSVQHRFDGTLKRQAKGMQDLTSLSLFCNDVECLLRDLYGDIESEALDRVLRAVFRIVEAFTKYVRPDLAKEHRDAEDFDWILGIGVPEGYGINGSDWRRGMKAIVDLFGRVREVNANPSAFSEYTREFAKLFAERWDCTKELEWETEWMPC
jgi:hypothetical protein